MDPTGVAVSQGRRNSLDRWWGQLSDFERASTRRAAWTEDEMPGRIFLQLVDAGIVAVSDIYRQTIMEDHPSSVMPTDVRVFVLAQIP